MGRREPRSSAESGAFMVGSAGPYRAPFCSASDPAFRDTPLARALPSGFGVPHECPEPEKERHVRVVGLSLRQGGQLSDEGDLDQARYRRF